MAEWHVQQAKAELSALIQASHQTPQIITRHGDPVAVVLSYSQYQALRAQAARPQLFSFLKSWPELQTPPRDPAEFGRNVDL